MPEKNPHIESQIASLKQFADGLTDWVWMIDLDGNHTFSNNVIENRLGYTVEEFLSTPFLQLVHVDDASEIQTRLPKLIEEKRGWQHWTIRWRAKTGEYVHYSSSASPVLDENGRVVGFRGIDREHTVVTDQMQKFKEAKAFWESAFEHVGVLLLVADKTGKLVFANNVARSFGGVVDSQSLLYDFLSPKFEHILRRNVGLALNGKIVSSFETTLRTSDGSAIMFKNRLSPIYVNGEVSHVMMLSTDVSESRRVDEDLRALNARFKSILQASTNYIFTIDRFGKMTYANRGGKGYVVQDILGLSAYDFFTDESAKVYRTSLQKVFDTKTPSSVEVQTLNGEWVEVSMSPLGSGNIKEIVAVGQDITTKRATARQLLLHRERTQSLLYSSRDFLLCMEGEIDTRGYADKEQLLHLLLEKFTLVETNAEVNHVLMDESFDSPEGKSLFDLCATYPRIQQLFQLIAENDLHVSGDILELEIGGEIQYWEIHANTIASEGIVHRIWITGRNQTSLISDQIRIADQQRRIEQIFNLSPVGIAFADPKGRFHRVNAAASKLLGYSTDELLELSFRDLTVEGDLQQSMEMMKRLMSGEATSFSLRKSYLCKDGSTLMARLFVSGVYDENEKFVGSIAIIQDIIHELQAEELHKQQSRELERQVELRTRELQNANEELKKFSYSVSHDLRAPLRAISGFTSMFLQDYGDTVTGEGKHFLDQVVQSTKQMKELIDGLLDLSRLTAKDIKWEQVDVSRICAEVIDALKHNAEYAHIEFSVQPNMSVYSDSSLLSSAFLNLLDNAAKYSHKNTKAEVSIFCEDNDENIVLTFRDNGVGFDEKHKDRLFTAFQRLHSEEEFAGTGIGLATVQRVVHKLGGEIDATSEIGSGSTFTITFPKQRL